MKKIKNKGFTLTEILAVITVLTIIGLLVTAGIMGYFRRGKQEYNKKLENQLVLASKNYFAEHKEELPTSVNEKGYAYVTLPAMQSNNYIAKSFVDSEGRECSPSLVYVKQRPNNPSEYDYYPCLICQDKDGKEEILSENSQYCDPANWGGEKSNPDDPQGPDNPQQLDENSKCEYEKDGDNVTITEANMPTGLLSIAYYDETQNKYITIWTAPGGTPITEQQHDLQSENIPVGAKVYMFDGPDNSGNKVECKKKDAVDPTPTQKNGTPVCSFQNAPTDWIGTKADVKFNVVCASEDENGNKLPIEGKGGKKYIVANKKTYGTLSVKRNTTETSETQIVYDLTFTSKKSTEGITKVTVKEGTVKNRDDDRVNAEASTEIKLDRKAPTIKFTPKGTYNSSGKYKGYQNKFSLTIKCTDSGSGVKSFSVTLNGVDKSSEIVDNVYTATHNKRGTYKYTAVCVDNTGHTQTVTKTYKVLNKVTSQAICGCRKRVCAPGHSYTVYSYGWGATRERTQSLGGRSCGVCSAASWNNIGGNFWCTQCGSGYHCYERQCVRHSSTACSKYTCKIVGTCWH